MVSLTGVNVSYNSGAKRLIIGSAGGSSERNPSIVDGKLKANAGSLGPKRPIILKKNPRVIQPRSQSKDGGTLNDLQRKKTEEIKSQYAPKL